MRRTIGRTNAPPAPNAPRPPVRLIAKFWSLPPVDASPVVVLIDYDNVEELNRRRGLVDLLSISLVKLPREVLPDNAFVDTRLYGGWYERDRLTTLAEDLRSEIDQQFPTVLRFAGVGHKRRIKAVAELARSLLISPRHNIFNTFRSHRSAPRFRSIVPPYAGCSTPNHCLMSAIGPLISRPSCPAVTCHAKLRDIFMRPGQKLVDTMLTADAIFLASSQHAVTLVIVTNDDDLWPAILTAGHLGASIHHIHPIRNRKTPDIYLPSAPRSYFQYSF